jgi:hypothetical protein
MINRFFFGTVAGLMLYATAVRVEAQPRRIAQNCSTSTRTCKPPVKRLVPCPNDPSRLCIVMRGSELALNETEQANQVVWKPIAGATYYQVTVSGYNTRWQSEILKEPKLDYSLLQLTPGAAYLVKITAHDINGRIIKTLEKAINVPTALTASSR